MEDCVICGVEHVGGDPTAKYSGLCPECRSSAVAEDATVRALVAQAHAEGRMPPELRVLDPVWVDVALE